MNLCVFWICLPKLPHACVRICSRISKLGLVQSPDTLISRLGYWIISIHGNKESPLVSRDGSPRGEMRVDGSPCDQTPFPLCCMGSKWEGAFWLAQEPHTPSRHLDHCGPHVQHKHPPSSCMSGLRHKPMTTGRGGPKFEPVPFTQNIDPLKVTGS